MGKIMDQYWLGKRVLITGHTGFKGMWLAIYLSKLGARITGMSNSDLTDKFFYKAVDKSKIFENEKFIDIRDSEATTNCLIEHNPEVVFHLAAQPLVSKGYTDPVTTFETNIMGTINVLQGIRFAPSVKRVICITSDKCYRNIEQIWGYREEDAMGGEDPYSASKGATEIVAYSMWASFLKSNNVGMVTARAGNVIGGGDFSQNRIMTDIVGAYQKDVPIKLRNPNATRPWQHVLEPVTAYEILAREKLNAETGEFFSYNIGPDNQSVKTVGELVHEVRNTWKLAIKNAASESLDFHEAMLLSLDNTKIKHQTSWRPRLSFSETVKLTLNWYRLFSEGHDALTLCLRDINYFTEEA